VNNTPVSFLCNIYSVLVVILPYITFYSALAELIFEITSLFPGIIQQLSQTKALSGVILMNFGRLDTLQRLNS
jgi:hypothetical protein